jgi:4-hydroxy-L-threonine phosphate dehydrogenase PdxA
VKAAVTALAAVIETVHAVAVEDAHPVQPAKVEVASGAAVRVTLELASKEAEQVAPQAMPAGVDETVPPPVPVLVTVRVYGIRVKVAVTVCAASIGTVHVPVPGHAAPVQPANVDVASGVGVSLTLEPASNEVEHVAPQAIPGGDDETVPPPVPALMTSKVY